jgi:hypothetical protein
MTKNNSTETGKVDLEAAKKALQRLESPKAKRERERAALFTELYMVIRDQIYANVSKSSIIKVLADQGMSLSNAMFDKLLADEAKRRGEPTPGKDDKDGEDVPALDNVHPNAQQVGSKGEVTA